MGIHVCDIGLYPTSDIGEWNVLGIIFMDQTGKCQAQKTFLKRVDDWIMSFD